MKINVEEEEELITGWFVFVSWPFDRPTASVVDGSGTIHSHELFAGLANSVDEGTVDWNISFHAAARSVRVFVTKRGVAVPNDVGQTVVSSFVGARCCPFIEVISANGFSTGVVIGHDESYFDDHSVCANGVHGIFGVGRSVIGTDELIIFEVVAAVADDDVEADWIVFDK